MTKAHGKNHARKNKICLWTRLQPGVTVQEVHGSDFQGWVVDKYKQDEQWMYLSGHFKLKSIQRVEVTEGKLPSVTSLQGTIKPAFSPKLWKHFFSLIEWGPSSLVRKVWTHLKPDRTYRTDVLIEAASRHLWWTRPSRLAPDLGHISWQRCLCKQQLDIELWSEARCGNPSNILS